MLNFLQKRRQSKEFNKLIVPRRRISNEKIFKNYFEGVLKKENPAFDEAYFKDIASVKIELEKAYWNLWLASGAIGAFLASRYFGNAEISLFGVSIKSPNGVREVLILVLSIIGIVLVTQRYRVDKLNVMLDVYAKHMSASDAEVFRMRYPDIIPTDLFFEPSSIQTRISGSYLASIIFPTVILGLMLLLTICILSAIGIANVIDIIVFPSFNLYVSWFVAAFYISSWLFAIGHSVSRHFPFRRPDYSIVSELSKLRELDKTAHTEELRKLSHQAYLNAGLKSPFDRFN